MEKSPVLPIIFFVGFALLILQRAVILPVRQLTQMARKLAKGDLAVELEVGSEDEVGQMVRAFKEMVNYIRGIALVSTRVATGDLTTDVTLQSDKDLLGNAFKQMTANLRRLVGQVADTANSVGAASQQLSATAEQSGQAANQVATTIQEVAAGTNQQAEGATRAVSLVEQMGHAINGVATGAQEQATAVGKSSEIARQMSNIIEQVAVNVTRLEEVRRGVGFSARRVNEMGKRSNQIGAILQTIDDIAGQTNLLALNAAIEAARAGEHGKGFAVVADEVRKPAEKSATAAQEIGGLISVVQTSVNEAVTAMDKSTDEVERQVKEITVVAQEMSTFSSQLGEAMETMSAVVEENTASTEEMAANSGEVVQAIKGIAGISEENSAATEEVSAATEEMNAQVEEVSASAQSLNAMAQELQAVVTRFTLDGSNNR